MKNLGHRLGASGTKLENTLEGLLGSFELVSDRRFRYWEFDIRESGDGVLFVFHDDSIMSHGELMHTKNMKFNDILRAGLSLGISIPKFREIVEELNKRDERVMIEIKYIHSDDCRNEVFDAVECKKKWMLMCTPSRFIDSFPSESRDYWRERAHESDIKLVRVGRHRVDLFRASRSKTMWIFAQMKWFFGF